MNVQNMTADIRPLPPYQALDLGHKMARAWFLPLWQLWFLAFLNWRLWLVFGFLAVIGWYFALELGWILWGFVGIVWLCRPIFEWRLLLFLGRKLFDDNTQMMDIYRAHTLSFSQMLALLRYKFSIQRTAYMAVVYLEQQLKKDQITRLNRINYGNNNAQVGHLVVFWLLELIWFVGGFLILLEIVYASATDLEVGWFMPSDENALWSALGVILYVLVSSVLAPFFVAGNFGLYVCQRSRLEGWDIELVFRQLAARYQTPKQEQNT